MRVISIVLLSSIVSTFATFNPGVTAEEHRDPADAFGTWIRGYDNPHIVESL